MPTPLSREALIEAFHSYGRPRQDWRIGGEFERFLLHGDGGAVSYEEPRGVRWVLEQLQARHGWTPTLEEGRPIGLTGGGGSITLEPGGQVELSGAPHRSLRAMAEEAWRIEGQLIGVLGGPNGDHVWAALGMRPYGSVADVPWMPKSRYRVMRDYLPGRGELALTMMKSTTSFQANYDYADEADCAAKVGLLASLSPLFTAIFANSPIQGGRETGYASTRAHVWTRTDPDRTGFPAALRGAYSHEAWVDYLLDVPMMFLMHGEDYVSAEGRSFRQWMEAGIDGVFPGWEDWALHQTSVFPEVRIKHTLEIRGTDAVSHPLSIAGIALWTGLLHDPVGLDEATLLAADFCRQGTPEERLALAARDGLGAETDREWADWAAELVEIADRALARSMPADRSLIEPLREQIASGESPAAAVVRLFREDPRPEVFLPRVAYRPAAPVVLALSSVS